MIAAPARHVNPGMQEVLPVLQGSTFDVAKAHRLVAEDFDSGADRSC
jgi:hypothetical protein